MSDLFQLVRLSGAGDLAIIGMTKNVGKTVTLNYLIRNFARSGIAPGLISAGYDGERFDRLTLREKPRIFAPAGSVVATAEACFEAAGAALELLMKSSFGTPLGEICIGRVKAAGLVELAGPGSAAALRTLVGWMKELGAAQVLVDGAVNRIASASPTVTGASVLATGAAVGPLLDDVVRKTVFRCRILETPVVDDILLLEAAGQGLSRGQAALLQRGGAVWRVETLHAPMPLLAGAELRRRCGRETAALALGGALVDSMLLEVGKLSQPPPAVVVRDAAKIFVTPEVYDFYMHCGGKIMVLQPINLLALTVNPTDPSGSGYEPRFFLEKLRAALAPRPVYDPVLEGDAVTV